MISVVDQCYHPATVDYYCAGPQTERLIRGVIIIHCPVVYDKFVIRSEVPRPIIDTDAPLIIIIISGVHRSIPIPDT